MAGAYVQQFAWIVLVPGLVLVVVAVVLWSRRGRVPASLADAG